MRTLSTLTLLAAATVALHGAGFTDIHPAASPSNSTWTNGVSSDGLVSVGRSTIGGSARAFKIIGGSYTQLNNLSGGFGSWATAASSTGSLIVGTSIDFNGADQAVSWAGVTPTLLDSGAILSSSSATGVSANGSVVVGYGFDATTSFVDKAFYHQTGVLNLITAMGAGNANRATGISANGNLIVGTESNDFNNATSSSGFIHTVGGTSTLVQADSAITAFNTAGLNFTQLTAISGNGAIAIGYASSSLNPGDEQAFKYNVSGATYAALGSLSVGGWSIARAINSDGSVIVGQSDNQAFKYQDGTLTPLGFLGTGNESDATGVSADGKVIVGYSRITNAGSIRHAMAGSTRSRTANDSRRLDWRLRPPKCRADIRDLRGLVRPESTGCLPRNSPWTSVRRESPQGDRRPHDFRPAPTSSGPTKRVRTRRSTPTRELRSVNRWHRACNLRTLESVRSRRRKRLGP